MITEISLVIPVRNEAETIHSLLRTIQQQIHVPDEIIIVDGGSEDGTLSILQSIVGGNSSYKIIETAVATPGKGRNLGIKEATSKWIALTDAGVQLDPSWLDKLIEAKRRFPDSDIIYGNFEPIIGTFFEQCASLAYVPIKLERGGELIRGPFIASSLINKKVWQKVGGFPDWRAAEDLEFMRRVEQAGFKIAWAPEATVWWQLRPDLWSTFKKFVLYSKHNSWAGQQRYWHHGLARQYFTWLIFSILGIFHSPWWALVPAIGYLGRVAKSIWIRREGRGILWALNPMQFLGVMVILLTIDLATFLGWIQSKFQSPGAGQGIT